MCSTDEIPFAIDPQKVDANLMNTRKPLHFKDEIKVPRIRLQDAGHVLGDEYEMITIDRMPLGNNNVNHSWNEHNHNHPKFNQDSCIKVKVFENDHLKELESNRTIT